MIKSRKLIFLSALVAGVLLFSFVVSRALENLQLHLAPPQVIGEHTQSEGNLLKVTRVVDGDTIHLEDGTTLRYIGIDTPETVDPRLPVQCFGREASDENKKLVEGKLVRLEKDISETDRYGRLLRYVWVKDEGGNEIFVNDYLVRQGFAHSYSYPPDINYQDQFKSSESKAREENLGLWQFCPAD